VYDAALDEYYCAPHAQFLEDAPGSSRGVWVPALQPSQQRCSSAATCYDMCFHCDGSPRYQPTVSTASLLYCGELEIDVSCSSDEYVKSAGRGCPVQLAAPHAVFARTVPCHMAILPCAVWQHSACLPSQYLTLQQVL
jgi:hypothetical protein